MSGEGPKRNRLDRLLSPVLRRPTVFAAAFLALLSLTMWRDGRTYVEDVSSTLMGIRLLTSGDSDHYLAIADAMREGDFRMAHVQPEPAGGPDRAHRQPGYPALLALAQWLGVQGAPGLALVSVAVLVASLWVAFAAVRLATGSALSGLVAAAVVYDARFLFDIATERLLTEPLYVAVALGAAGAALRHLTRPSTSSLVVVAVLGGLAYLVRVNGILLTSSLALGLLAADLQRARRASRVESSSNLVLHLPLGAYALAIAMFLVVTVPSWLPRTIYAGNPVYHGYLPNFLWVDDYERAHVAGPPRYSLSTYAGEHEIGDAARRMGWGIERVFWDTPRDKFGIVASLAAIAAIVVLVLLRDLPGLLLACTGVAQALPLAWIAVANPARRVPAAALLPFVALTIGAAVAAVLRRTTSARPGTPERTSRRIDNARETGP